MVILSTTSFQVRNEVSFQHDMNAALLHRPKEIYCGKPNSVQTVPWYTVLNITVRICRYRHWYKESIEYHSRDVGKVTRHVFIVLYWTAFLNPFWLTTWPPPPSLAIQDDRVPGTPEALVAMLTQTCRHGRSGIWTDGNTERVYLLIGVLAMDEVDKYILNSTDDGCTIYKWLILFYVHSSVLTIWL